MAPASSSPSRTTDPSFPDSPTDIPASYFHVVFTLPGELAAVGLRNRRFIYELLFRAASETLLALGKDPQRLGALLGITMVLHTWTRDLRFHPHVHAIVTGGGLSHDDQRWISTGRKYLFPVQLLGRLYRGKFLHHLARAHKERRLEAWGHLCRYLTTLDLERVVRGTACQRR